MYNKILVATDGSITADGAVSRAFALATQFKSTVILVTVGEENDAKIILDKVSREYQDTGIEIQTVTRPGDPASVILDVAEELVTDLIVVGNKGMQGARRFFLASVPNKIAHHAPCAVLIVKTT